MQLEKTCGRLNKVSVRSGAAAFSNEHLLLPARIKACWKLEFVAVDKIALGAGRSTTPDRVSRGLGDARDMVTMDRTFGLTDEPVSYRSANNWLLARLNNWTGLRYYVNVLVP